MLRLIVRREGHLDGARLAGADADELLLEPRNEGLRAEQDGRVVALTAFEPLAVDAALVRNYETVAIRRLLALALRRVRLVLIGDARERLLDFLVADVRPRLFKLLFLEISQLCRRHNLESPRVLEIGL